MPSARSVIVMAVAHSLGAVYSPDIMLWTRSKMQTSRLLDQTAEKVGRTWSAKASLPCDFRDKPVRSSGTTRRPAGNSGRPARWVPLLNTRP